MTGARRAVFAMVCAVVSLCVLSTAAQQPQPPTFRSGVRLVEVDVAVRDGNDRFVDTLTKDDFEVLEDGTPQRIQDLWVVNLPVGRAADLPAAAASPILPAPVGSAVDMGRLYVLVLGGGGPDRVKDIAHQFITEFLGPTDVMAVVHVSNGVATQGLTANRELLLASVDRYRGGGGSEASLRMLKEVAVSLNASTGRRKTVLFIHPGFNLWSTGGRTAGAVDQGVAALKLTRVFEDVTRTAKRNNVRIYPISPVGYAVSMPDMTGQSLGPPGQVIGPGGGTGIVTGGGDAAASLRILAADTRGIAIANTNNYGGNFKHIVRDNSAYYLLTYDSTADADGRAHPITVRLRKRADLSLRQGRASFIAPTPDVKGRSVRLPKSLSAEARGILAASVPVQGPGIELFTAVFQAADFNGSILIGTHVPGAWLRLAPRDTIELSYVAVDRWGAVRAVEQRTFTLNLGEQSRAQVEQTGLRLFGRLQVPRGQYQIRVAAHQANGGTASAAADVEVPDYADQALTVSDFVVASSHGPTLTTLEEDALLRGALPAQPTPVRRFGRGEMLTVFAEIYDSHWIVSQEVGVTMTVAAADGRLVFRGERVLTAANRGRFNLRATLPLGPFAPGNYELLVEAHTRKGIPANTSRQMPFTVLDGDAPTAAREAALSVAHDALEFDFASLRRAPPVSAAPAVATSGTRAGLVVVPDGRFEARGQTLAGLARVAFGFDDVDPSRGVVKADDWMWTDRFDITAAVGHPWTTPPPGTTVPAEVRTMLRALLKERFGLKARIETKKVDVTALELAKSERLGPGLRPSAAVCRGPFTDASPDEAVPKPQCGFTNNRDGIRAEAVTMAEAAQLITQLPTMELHRPLVDATGLPGLYDLSFSVPWKENRLRGMDTIPLELEAQLGLRIKGARMPLPTLIIERATKPRED